MRWFWLAMLAACGDHGSSSKPPAAEPPPVPVRADAAMPIAAGGDTHIDDDVEHAAPVASAPTHPGHPIDITLRSTPAGAQVAVDGAVIGNTPAYWSGTADGREHEFVFTLRGYGIARYRFVPITSGVVHSRLEAISEDVDAGVLPPPEVVPHRNQPSAIAPPTAPPTITPDAAEPQMPGLGPQN